MAAAVSEFGRLDAAVFLAGRHGEVMKAFDLPPSPAATRDSFSYDPTCERNIFDIRWPAWHDDYEMMVLAPMRLAKAAQPRAPFPLGPTRLALHGFIKLLADSHARDGVRFNAIARGLMESGKTEVHPEWADTVPMGRVGRTVAFLLSEGAVHITGQCLTVDGGVNRAL